MDPKAAAESPPVISAPTAGDRKKSLLGLPLFKKASETLGAQIWHVDDDFNPIAPPRPVPTSLDEAEDSEPQPDKDEE